MENEQVQTPEQPTQTVEQPKSEAAKKLMENIKPILELKEPIFLPKLAEKFAKRLSLIYLIGLIVLTCSLLMAMVSVFSSPVAGLFNLVMTAVWFIVFRMLCETLLAYQPATETPIEAPEAPAEQ